METMTSADPEILESNQNHEIPNNSNDMELSNSDPTQTKMINEKADNASPNGVSDGQSEDGKEQSDNMAVDETIEVAPLVNPDSEDVATASALSLALIPAMKGKLTVENKLVLCKGVWAMSEASLTVPDQTSNFEFKLVKADEGCHSFPYTGKYQGWFHLKPPPPTKNPIKIDERDIRIEFTAVEDSNSEFTVVGRGTNKFGKYNLKGKLDGTGEIILYREYEPKIVSVGPRKRSSTGEIKTNLARSSSDASMVESVISPREGGRIRKQSSLMKEYEESQVKPFSPRAVSSIAEKGKKEKQFESSAKVQKVETVSTSLITASGRSQRMPQSMQKCSDLLKEMSKNRFAIWFLEPVDWVKLNLPDYPRIIKSPMDFKTIGEKLEKREYESPDLFAEDMRLVFRNAILFNQLQNDPVHMAARELAKKFEDRYRQISALFTSDSITYTEAFALEKSTKLKSKKAKSIANPIPTPRGRGPKAFPPGPRAPVHYFPPAVDGSSHQLLELQKTMEAMRQELQDLRSAVKVKEIEKKVDAKLKNSDSIPLSYEEKKRLIGQINLLPPEPMQGVIDIVREAPGAGDQDEILIDELDNATQRKLQVFVHNYFHQKKKTPKRASGPKPDGPKRLRKPKANNNSGYTTYNAPAPNSNLAEATVEDDELLFGFEELRSGVQKTDNGSDASDLDEDNAFDQKLQSSAANGQPKSQDFDDVDDDFGDMVENPLQNNSDLQIGNADSWTTSHFDETPSNNEVESSASWNDAAESFKQNKKLEEMTKAESEKLLQQRLNAEVARANPNL